MIDTGIDQEQRKKSAERLHALLANEYVLYTKTLKYHWNVRGDDFGALHLFFENHYKELFIFIDDAAERAQMIGFDALGTLEEFKQHATIKENPGQNPDAMNMIKDLLAGHEVIIKQLRSDVDLTAQLSDYGTNNFMADLLEKHEKMAWMLRAHTRTT